MEFDLQAVLDHPAVKGALAGIVAAAAVDIDAFRKFESFEQAKAYKWDRALFRWIQGAIAGAIAGLGLTAV